MFFPSIKVPNVETFCLGRVGGGGKLKCETWEAGEGGGEEKETGW